MSFALKNARATYQQLVNEIFKEQIGCTMEVYIDDMIAKSVYASEYLGHIRDIFVVLRRHQGYLGRNCPARWHNYQYVQPLISTYRLVWGSMLLSLLQSLNEVLLLFKFELG